MKDKRKHFISRRIMKRHVQCFCERVLFAEGVWLAVASIEMNGFSGTSDVTVAC